jgi:hypothetical protein
MAGGTSTRPSIEVRAKARELLDACALPRRTESDGGKGGVAEAAWPHVDGRRATPGRPGIDESGPGAAPFCPDRGPASVTSGEPIDGQEAGHEPSRSLSSVE